MKNFAGNPFSEKAKKRVFLVGICLNGQRFQKIELGMNELNSLCRTLEYEVTGQEIQNRTLPEPATCIGKGKLEELKERREEYDSVVFNLEITPKQQQKISDFLKCDVIDRTYLILKIFSEHAQTKEAKTQVELARLNYLLPRLTGMWTHLDREKGGAGVSKGTGEKQINIDRNLIQKEIINLKKKLKKIEIQKNTRKKTRRDLFQASLVGYTNAGKSSLMNLLTGSDVLVEDKLFATLDSTMRSLKTGDLPNLLLSDTVGFIREIPHSLIVSFRSTLESVAEANLLLHVVDASEAFVEERIRAVESVLDEIHAKKIDQILIFNKIDQIQFRSEELLLRKNYPQAVFVSALEPETHKVLCKTLIDYFAGFYRKANLTFPYDDSGMISRLYQNSIVRKINYTDSGIEVDCLIAEAEYKKLGLAKFYATENNR